MDDPRETVRGIQADTTHFYDHFDHHRWLAGDDPVRVDYSVLSVGVMTLGLIMVVELLRHKIDHAAHSRPFFKTVLEGVYSELATLGIVELFLYMLSTYYEDLDKQKYYVFADIHFALFYTAILNAFQSVLLAALANGVARKVWVETEMLELNHYVEIREEFEQVKKEMERINSSISSDKETAARTSDSSFKGQGTTFEDKKSFPFWKKIAHRFQYPALQRRYTALLLQVRFHELRVHFLQAYNLPLMLKVSDYLLLSQQQVLLKLVHVSSIAWTLLTGAVNVLYFVLGIVSYKVADSTIVGTALIWIFFWSMSLFVLLAAVVHKKMKAIFREIMVEKTLWDINNVKAEAHDRLAAQQKALFWGSDPKLVIAVIQFMQFGYAVTFSVVLIFWQEIDDGNIPIALYLFVSVFCYAVFLRVTAQVIPQYTMCTSLGQLVDHQRLNETLANHFLEETRRQEAERAWMEAVDKAAGIDDHNSFQIPHKSSRPEIGHPDLPITESKKPSRALMAELVKLDTDSLRTSLPEEERDELDRRQQERERRRAARRKIRSEGVATMAAMGQMTLPSLTKAKDDFFLSSTPSGDHFFRPPSVNLETSDDLKPEDTTRASLRERRRRSRRTKSVSDGVAAMSRMSQTVLDTLAIPSVVAEEPSESSISFSHMVKKAPANVTEEPGSSMSFLPAFVPPAQTHRTLQLSTPEPSAVMTVPPLEQDNMSVQSEDGHSDVDDLPEVEMFPKHAESPVPVAPVAQRLRGFLLSKKYIVVSNVLGTLVVFFLVGQRIERFLHSEGIVSEKFVSFDFNNVHTFWALFVMLCMFAVVDCFILATTAFQKQRQSRVEKKAFVAAGLDLLLVAGCLALFIIAEMQRCCEKGHDEIPGRYSNYSDYHSEYSHDRGLAGEQNDYGYDTYDYYNDPPECGCPEFGQRLYGGLGRIEPFIALIALRVLRHWAAANLTKRVRFSKGIETEEDCYDEGIPFDPFAVFDESDRHGGGHDSHGGQGGELRGTAAELWKVTIGKYPDIAQKYGEFSSEILKLMLGISIQEHDDEQKHVKPRKISVSMSEGSAQSFILGREHMSLVSPGGQEVVSGGKVVTSVKRASMFVQSPRGFISGDEEAVQHNSPVPRLDNTFLPSPDVAFRSPHARLVRSMRRCDRKLLPILDKWTAVDVVLTRVEMVYFEAAGADETRVEGNSAKQALVATKGGKGLRLCDVAEGRRVVGRLELADIEYITVERELPLDEGTEETDGPEFDIKQTEFWKMPGKSGGVQFPRSSRWCKVKQDRLHIKTVLGRELYLRFYSDLDDAEQHPERLEQNEETGADSLDKNNALQWVQTIGRYCGPEQLKQSLPHFGAATDDELRDYMVVHPHKFEDSKKIHQRNASTGDLRALFSSMRRSSQDGTSPKRAASFRRMKSMDDSHSAFSGIPKPDKQIRAKSVGSSFVGGNEQQSNSSKPVGRSKSFGI